MLGVKGSMNDMLTALYFNKCDCQPRVDIKTYRMWKEEGVQVQKGERGCKLSVVVEAAQDDGEVKRYIKGTTVFCRHQVEKAGDRIEGREPFYGDE